VYNHRKLIYNNGSIASAMDRNGLNKKLSFPLSKRMYGEYVAAIRFENMIKEMIIKVLLYNLVQRITFK